MEFDLFDGAYNAVLQASTYEDFSSLLQGYDCRKCPRCEARSKIVVDRGNPSAEVMIISERPGNNEDVHGQAFVGRAGEQVPEHPDPLGSGPGTSDALYRGQRLVHVSDGERRFGGTVRHERSLNGSGADADPPLREDSGQVGDADRHLRPLEPTQHGGERRDLLRALRRG